MKDIKIVQRYHGLLKSHKVLFIVSLFFCAISASLWLLPPLFLRIILDFSYPLKNISLLNLGVGAIFVVYFLYLTITAIYEYVLFFIYNESTFELTKKTFASVAKLPISIHVRKSSQDLLRLITEDVKIATSMITSLVPTALIDVIKIAAILGFAFYLKHSIALLAILVIPACYLEIKLQAKRKKDFGNIGRDIEPKIFTSLQEKLTNIKTIKAFGQEEYETLKLGHLLKRAYRNDIKERVFDIAGTLTNSIALQAWTALLIWYLSYLYIRSFLTIGEVVALFFYLEMIIFPIKSLLNLVYDWKSKIAVFHKLDEIFNAAGEETIGLEEELTISDGEIKTENLSFSYSGAIDLLDEVDINFLPHSVTAIVGRHGSGKRTLINLLMRFFKPSEGIILIDGQNISHMMLHSLRGKIGVISHENSLFSGSIIENILYGNEVLERGDAMRAAKMAGADEFIERLPGGYDSEVGIGGSLLSRGQRQRIAIARVLLKNPSIVILDETSEELDAETEFKVQEIIARLRKTKTVIVLANRLSTVRSADNIYVCEKGKFLENGNFDDLMAKKAAFYRFYWRQFGGLASLRNQLQVEFERTTRYGSKFTLSILKILNFDEIAEKYGFEVADTYIDSIDQFIRRQIRIGDNSAKLEGNTILILLPEISEEQIGQFFTRIRKALIKSNEFGTITNINDEDLLLIGTRITKKTLKTPEEILEKLKMSTDAHKEVSGFITIAEDDLTKG